jgi:hypothetical protein
MIKRAPRGETFTVLPNRTLEDDRLSWEAIGLLSFLLSKPDDWTVRKSHLVASRDAGEYKIKRILTELEDAGYLQRERIQKDDGTFDWVSVVYDRPQDEEREESTIPQSSTDGSSIDGSSSDGSSIDGKPPDITKTDSNKDGSNKEGEREARAKRGNASCDTGPQRNQREQQVRLLRQIKNGEWEGQIRPQEDWQAKMYTCAHPDYNPQSLTKLEWRETISDPTAWAKSILIGIKRGWQPHTVDAREDRYEQIVSGGGSGRAGGQETSRVSIEEFGSHR